MLRFLRLFLALLFSQLLIGALALLLFFGTIASYQSGPPIESGSVLWVPLQGEIIEYATLPSVPFLRRRPLSQKIGRAHV